MSVDTLRYYERRGLIRVEAKCAELDAMIETIDTTRGQCAAGTCSSG